MGLTHAVESSLLGLAWRLVRAIGPVRASNLGGWLARMIGPRLPVSRVGRRNLALAFPELAESARENILRGTWDNLGRTAAELPHVADLEETSAGPGFEVQGREHFPPRGPAILVSGHLGNWEILPLAAARAGSPVASFYRAAANPAVDARIVAARRRASGAPGFAKGTKGAKDALIWLRDGGMLAMLVDQKMNDGIEARFFGRPAMTASAAAVFALRYRCPLILARSIRLGPARARIVCDPPLELPDSGDRTADIAALTQAINDRLEASVRAHPAQWLWLHRRWPREDYSNES